MKQATTDLSFGQALDALEAGCRVARSDWNGKDMWLSLSGPSPYRSITADAFWSKNNADYARSTIDGCANVLPCITMKNAQGHIQMGWAPTQSDMFSKNWFIVEWVDETVSTCPTSFDGDSIIYARHALLEILTTSIAPAIAAAPWEATKLAEGVTTALNILAPLPKEAA